MSMAYINTVAYKASNSSFISQQILAVRPGNDISRDLNFDAATSFVFLPSFRDCANSACSALPTLAYCLLCTYSRKHRTPVKVLNIRSIRKDDFQVLYNFYGYKMAQNNAVELILKSGNVSMKINQIRHFRCFRRKDRSRPSLQ